MNNREQAILEVDALILHVESRIQNFDYDVRMASTSEKKDINKIILAALKHCLANLCYAKEQIRNFETHSSNR